MTEGTVTYDIKFNVINPLKIFRPNTRDLALMMINIEGQTYVCREVEEVTYSYVVLSMHAPISLLNI